MPASWRQKGLITNSKPVHYGVNYMFVYMYMFNYKLHKTKYTAKDRLYDCYLPIQNKRKAVVRKGKGKIILSSAKNYKK